MSLIHKCDICGKHITTYEDLNDIRLTDKITNHEYMDCCSVCFGKIKMLINRLKESDMNDYEVQDGTNN